MEKVKGSEYFSKALHIHKICEAREREMGGKDGAMRESDRGAKALKWGQ